MSKLLKIHTSILTESDLVSELLASTAGSCEAA